MDIPSTSVYSHEAVDHSIVSESAELMQVLVALITCVKRLLLNLGGAFGPQELSRTAKYGHSARPLKAGAPENTMEILINRSGVRSSIIHHQLPKPPPHNVLDFNSKTEGIDLDFLKAKSGEEARARDRIHQLLSLLSNELSGEMSRQLRIFNAESSSRANQARKRAIAAQQLKTGAGAQHLRQGTYAVGDDTELPKCKAEAAQERAEAADAIMRLLEEYHLLDTVDSMAYLKSTIESTLPKLRIVAKRGAGMKKGAASAVHEEDSLAKMLQQNVADEGTSPIAAAAAMITAGASRVDGGKYGLYESVSEQGSGMLEGKGSMGSLQSAPSYGSNNFSSYYGLRGGPGAAAAEAEHRAIVDPEAQYREAAMRERSFPIDRAMAVVHQQKVNSMSQAGHSYGGGYHTGLSHTGSSSFGRHGYGGQAQHAPKGLSFTHPESAASLSFPSPAGSRPAPSGMSSRGAADSARPKPSMLSPGPIARGPLPSLPAGHSPRTSSPALHDPLKYTRGTPIPLQPIRSHTPQERDMGDWDDTEESMAKALAARHHEQERGGGNVGSKSEAGLRMLASPLRR